MRWLWSTTAGLSRRPIVQALRPSCNRRPGAGIHSNFLRLEYRPTTFAPTRSAIPHHVRFQSSVASTRSETPSYTTFTVNVAASHSLVNEEVILSEHPTHIPCTSSVPLSYAQISRAAAQSVRQALAAGSVATASYIVTSLRVPIYAARPREDWPVALRRVRAPIDFGQHVSSRAAAHALVHGFLRLGMVKQAHRASLDILADGTRLRGATLEAILAHLSGSVVDATPVQLSPRILRRTDAVAPPNPRMLADPCARYAAQLLLAARTYRQYRSGRMYKSVVDACLLQGEIIFGSLLFVLLVKDWQRHKAQVAHAEETGQLEPEEGYIKGKSREFLTRRDPAPDPEIMERILAQIKVVFDNPKVEKDDPRLFESLQALANLASLLDDRSMPTQHVSKLIAAIYSCPRIDGRLVWVRINTGADPPEVRKVKVYDYLHGVLERLIITLPTTRPYRIKHPTLPPLDLASYNSLIHYALRHRLDPEMAENVLNHMTRERQPPLQPNTSTYNILLRSGTLLRRNDISEHAAIQLSKRDAFWYRPPHQISSKDSVDFKHPTAFQQKLADMLQRRLRLHALDPMHPSDCQRTRPDVYSITSYISHLVSTGRPDNVAQLLFSFIPELNIIDHPSGEHTRPEERRALREGAVARAASYGPYLFAVVLNALQKAGKTGLAERVWLLATQAEQASWVLPRGPDGAPRPWCLSVHAYTSMLQVYAAEARRAAALLAARRAGPAQLLAASTAEQRLRAPRVTVRGWAWAVSAQARIPPSHLKRHDAAARMGKILIEGMRNGARHVYGSLERLRATGAKAVAIRGVTLPVPDARFYNAALDVFGRAKGERRTSTNRPGRRARVRRRIGRAIRRIAERGPLYRADPTLVRLLEDMRSAGLPVPLAYQDLLSEPRISVNGREGMHTLSHAPYAFPHPDGQSFRAHAMETQKTRGLPISRRLWKRVRRRSNTAEQ